MSQLHFKKWIKDFVKENQRQPNIAEKKSGAVQLYAAYAKLEMEIQNRKAIEKAFTTEISPTNSPRDEEKYSENVEEKNVLVVGTQEENVVVQPLQPNEFLRSDTAATMFSTYDFAGNPDLSQFNPNLSQLNSNLSQLNLLP